MTDNMEKLIDSYYEDSIELSDHKLLCFKRITDYKCTDRKAVKISVEDLETETTIDLATYFDAKWIFSSPMSESIFWQYAKEHRLQFKEVFSRMREKVPGKEFHMYKIRFNQLFGKSSTVHDTLTAIFKEEKDV